VPAHRGHRVGPPQSMPARSTPAAAVTTSRMQHRRGTGLELPPAPHRTDARRHATTHLSQVRSESRRCRSGTQGTVHRSRGLHTAVHIAR
jgi:hypothetical protein